MESNATVQLILQAPKKKKSYVRNFFMDDDTITCSNIKTDMGPGRLTPTKEHIDWREQLRLRGVYYVGSCPNATSVNAEMDEQFGSYKGACRLSTQRCYNGKLFDRMEKIREH